MCVEAKPLPKIGNTPLSEEGVKVDLIEARVCLALTISSVFGAVGVKGGRQN